MLIYLKVKSIVMLGLPFTWYIFMLQNIKNVLSLLLVVFVYVFFFWRVLGDHSDPQSTLASYFRPSSPSKGVLSGLEKENTEVPPAPWTTVAEKGASQDEPRRFDSTGMFHWCPARSIDEAIMVNTHLKELGIKLQNNCD